MLELKKNRFTTRKGPLVLVIMDGVGLGPENEGNAVYLARTPTLDKLWQECPHTRLRAHGTAVGLPSDGDMGNSEVGHNALGAGRIFDQGAKLVARAIDSGAIFTTELWASLVSAPRDGSAALHFIGLLSDGNVHSHIDHLFKLIGRSSEDGVRKLRVHILLDGRDVPETSALEYVDRLETFLENFSKEGFDYRVASGGGRMVTTMDRYEADWNIVKRGWEAHVLGAARPFASAREAIETFRKEDPGVIDQYLPSFTITEGGYPVGPVNDGDSVVFFNFRGDRAIQISRAFDENNFAHFDRVRVPNVLYAGMMEYDGDLGIPKKYLVLPPSIDRTISEYLANTECCQFAISETQKFGHVTYFWNGNRSGKFNEETEVYEEIPSDRVEFDRRPWMKAAEITDRVIEVIGGGDYFFIRLNYPNGDMVGHTGNLHASIIAAETVDLCLGRLLDAVRGAHGIALITADHGNLDDMFETDKNGNFLIDKKTGRPAAKTAHSLNPVPFIIFDPDYNGEYVMADVADAGLGNVAATILTLLGYEPPEGYLDSLVKPV